MNTPVPAPHFGVNGPPPVMAQDLQTTCQRSSIREMVRQFVGTVAHQPAWWLAASEDKAAHIGLPCPEAGVPNERQLTGAETAMLTDGHRPRLCGNSFTRAMS